MKPFDIDCGHSMMWQWSVFVWLGGQSRVHAGCGCICSEDIIESHPVNTSEAGQGEWT